ncbi:Hsp20/alpha crystallin family protein [Ligilactobacillus pobuzihii]|uniref:Heat shock protein Hsp20 n=1 Tax=Ligilactobacillus pobuzihii TaxID=449659 RepID=A0A0R2L7S7_9LACO|nr:Hsp20/alpha crystallin family protein [Ligilactobacillus pobuzihii]KRK11208.1 heat shock protein Hsp20 [Ligilactobacillus pobuzihii E100301 = KCTC 13174]KRN95846.1 heat shock protein Hsp20 [Ligilactobacillus pobuzihii]GEN47783.1 molecular chaperone [Ligilactobacillus pobuzihii]
MNELANNLNQLMHIGDGFFEDFGEPLFTMDSSNNMKSDVIKTDNGYQVTVDIPGVDKDNIDLSYDQDVLSIKAKRDSTLDQKDKENNVIASERSYGEYVRNYRLPDVLADKISAKAEDGVLTIDLPKAERKETGHKIEIG